MKQHPRNKKRQNKRWLKWAVWITATLVAILVIVNAAMWVIYRERVLPNVSLGNLYMGNISYSEVADRSGEGALLSEQINLKTPLKTESTTPEDLGVSVNVAASIDNLKSQRTWLPLIKILRPTTVPLELEVDSQKYSEKLGELTKQLYSAPLPLRVTFDGQGFVVSQPEQGYEVSELQNPVLAALANGQTTVQVPAKVLTPPESEIDVESARQALQSELQTNTTYIFGDQARQIAVADKGSWYEQDGQVMVPSEQKVKQYVQGLAGSLGVEAANPGDIALATLSALENKRDIELVVSTQNAALKLAYCTDARGLESADLARFTQRVAAILADKRGWNNGGEVSFNHSQDCDFTIWLSAPGSMTSFGAICDEYYSCRVGDDVIINYDRWTKATDPWNAAGMNITDYQALVVNHEVGHRLGFGHPGCPGQGQLAPVMMQQSIELGGCKFNPWPTADELNDVI